MLFRFSLFFIGLISIVSPLTADECATSLFWLRGDYLLWAIKKNPLPTPLVTTVSYSDSVPGAIGQSGTKVAMGNEKIGMGWMNGFQVAAGSWLTESHRIGLEASYFLLPKVTKDESLYTSGEVGSPAFAVPIFDVTGFWGLNGVPGETIYLLPGPLLGTQPGFQGKFHLRLSSKFQGAEINGVFRLANWCRLHLDVIEGFRWLNLQEDLRFEVKTNSVPDFPFPPPSFTNTYDRFSTSNNFYAGQIGCRALYEKQHWDVESTFKVGLGGLSEFVRIRGRSQTSNGNLFYATMGTAGETLHGGIFAQPSNIGTYHKQKFAVSLEANVRGSWRITKNIGAALGYNFLWLSKVTRPGNLIDRKINPTRTALASASRETVGTTTSPTAFGEPGPAQLPQGKFEPDFNLHGQFWAQGLTAGLEFRF